MTLDKQVTKTLDELVLALPDLPDMRAALERAAQAVREVVTGCTGASVTVEHETMPFTVASTDEETLVLDNVQFAYDRGPCLSAMREGHVVEIHDLATDGRWPPFAEAAMGAGVRMTLSVPLLVGPTVIGVLNLYSAEGFTDAARPIAEELAARTGVTLRAAGLYFDSRSLAEDLQAAMASRAVIEQAKGVLMAQNRCSAEDAFNLLVRASMRENIKVRDLAARLVASLFDGSGPPG